MGYFKSQEWTGLHLRFGRRTGSWCGIRERWDFGSAGTSGALGLRERRDFGSAGTSES